jgi:ComF family protein
MNCRIDIGENDNGLCQDCWSQLLESAGPDYCPRCGRDASRYAILNNTCPNCQGEDLIFDAIARTGIYTKTLRKLILAFKSDKTELSTVLALMANTTLQVSSFYNDIDLFTPVPLHWSRRLVRGYNQSYLIAKKINHPSAAVNTDLVRIHRTKLQSAAASPTKRAANIVNAFAVRYRHNFAGKNVCLVDDIKTTGATLNECAKTLKQAGAKKVFTLVLAVAGQNSG